MYTVKETVPQIPPVWEEREIIQEIEKSAASIVAQGTMLDRPNALNAAESYADSESKYDLP